MQRKQQAAGQLAAWGPRPACPGRQHQPGGAAGRGRGRGRGRAQGGHSAPAPLHDVQPDHR